MSGWAAAAQVAGSLLDSYIQGDRNRKEAKKQRDWQEEMSNTAYQRAAKDLEAAGLNRILALGNPASTPSGATASIEAPKISNAVQTGINASSAKAAIAQSNAQTAVLDADQDLRKEQLNTERMKQHLMKDQQIQSQTQADYNSAAAAHQNAQAIKVGTWNPVQKLGSEVLEKLANFGRNAAKAYSDLADKKANEMQIKKSSNEKFVPIQRKYRSQ